MPAAFKDAGYLLSSVILILLAFMSFLTATFVIESMAAANALLAWRQVQRQKKSGGERQSSEVVVRANSSQLGSPVRRAFGEETEEEGRRLRGEQERQPLIQEEEGGRRGAARRGYEIREITEMGRMAGLFFSRGGRNLFYICLVRYTGQPIELMVSISRCYRLSISTEIWPFTEQLWPSLLGT